MVRTYNIGTECYALLFSPSDPEFMLPVKVVILEKHTLNSRTTYKVKIRDVFETNLNLLKERLPGIKVPCNMKSDAKTSLVRKDEMEPVGGMAELLPLVGRTAFFIEDAFMKADKDGLYDLYNRFVKYIINYHYRRLYDLCNRSFLSNQPVYENQKAQFLKRVNAIGFGDVFEKFGLELEI